MLATLRMSCDHSRFHVATIHVETAASAVQQKAARPVTAPDVDWKRAGNLGSTEKKFQVLANTGSGTKNLRAKRS